MYNPITNNENLPQGWNLLKLKELSNYISRGKQPKYIDGSPLYVLNQKAIQTDGIKKEFLKQHDPKKVVDERHFIKINDIVINSTGTGTVGRVYHFIDIPDETLFTDTHVTTIRVKEDQIVPRFLYYQLIHNNYQRYILKTFVSGSTGQVELNKSSVEEFPVIFPSIQNQQKIIKPLTYIDQKIKLNKAIISNLEGLAQTLFKRWFVDFEFPNEERKPYKSSGGKMVESEIGMIPEGWEVKQLNEIVKHSKKTFNPNKEEQIQVAHFSLPAYDSKQYPIFEDSKTIKSNKYYIDENSVMFSRMNPKTSRTWLPNIQIKYVNVCSSEYVVLDTSLHANKGYIFSLIMSNDFNNYLINNATGSTNSRQRVRPEVSLKYTFAHNKNKAREFEQKVGSFYKEIINLREEIFSLSNIRDTLLPKLLSGEIELPDVTEVTDDVPIS